MNCPDCDVTLTWHRKQGRLRCHLCDFSRPAGGSCPSCGSAHLLGIGAGTERLEEGLQANLPTARIARFDRDTAAGQRLHQTLEAFGRGDIDVLVGTQMLAKGHDFPSVTLVGVVLAESGLMIPDFRAAERTFQLLTQVAGRAGRGHRPGRVLVQTYQPEHPAIASALRHDHTGFVAAELAQRQRLGYPPFAHLVLVETRHTEDARAQTAMIAWVEALRAQGLEVRGPMQAGVSRMRGICRWHALIRSTDRRLLHQGLRQVERTIGPAVPPGVEWVVDVDPVGFG